MHLDNNNIDIIDDDLKKYLKESIEVIYPESLAKQKYPDLFN